MIKLNLGIIFIFLAVCISSSLGLPGSNCTYDYDCDAIPYEVCLNSSSSSSPFPSLSCTLLPGFGVDGNTNKIYFLGRCGGPAPIGNPNYNYTNAGTVYIFSANLDGTSITPVIALEENTELVANSIIAEFWMVSPTDFFFIRTDQLSRPWYDSIDRKNFTESVLANTEGVSVSLDYTTGKTYGCFAYGTIFQSTAINLFTFNPPYTVLYTDTPYFGYCKNLKVIGNNLYILGGQVYNTDAIYLGNINGSQPLDSPFLIDHLSSPYAFDADSSAVYYTSQYSVNRFFINGHGGPTLLVDYPDHKPFPNFTTLQVLNDELYFDDGAWIRRVNTTSLATDDLIPYQFSYTAFGECACLSGFSGDNCQTCENGQVQWSNGIPNCVSYVANTTFPSTCSQDYQCGNPPYTICDDNQCKCRETFSGASCTSCSESVSWDQGIPSCLLSNQNNNTSVNCNISQSLRTQWTSSGNNFYLYDITIYNSGSQDIITPGFFIESIGAVEIAQSWNLVLYANTIPTQRLASLFPNTLISVDSSYTSSGYINQGNQTTLVLSSCSA